MDIICGLILDLFYVVLVVIVNEDGIESFFIGECFNDFELNLNEIVEV